MPRLDFGPGDVVHVEKEHIGNVEPRALKVTLDLLEHLNQFEEGTILLQAAVIAKEVLGAVALSESFSNSPFVVSPIEKSKEK